MTLVNSFRNIQNAAMTLNASCAEVFPLLCPVREMDWLPHWQCEMVYSDSGRAEDNCIFRTEFPGDRGRETWTVSRYEPVRAIEFIRFTPDIKITRLDVHLYPKGDQTLAIWHRTVTALGDRGRKVVESMDQGEYEEEIRSLEGMLNHYLVTGRMKSDRVVSSSLKASMDRH
ncbi:MAG: hypothetical protein PVH30_10945 [Desulfobacterales bacterium]|jgi:hypothetical protein